VSQTSQNFGVRGVHHTSPCLEFLHHAPNFKDTRVLYIRRTRPYPRYRDALLFQAVQRKKGYAYNERTSSVVVFRVHSVLSVKTNCRPFEDPTAHNACHALTRRPYGLETIVIQVIFAAA
jgi:hypothetical protein